jgi:hypothetical protein
MIDFTGVTAITIPEGNVAKITRGMEPLWEKPTSDLGYTIVFPATTFTKEEFTYENGWTYMPEQVLTRVPSDGERYAIFVNGVEYDYVAEVRGSSIELCVNGDMFMAIADFDGTNRNFYTILYDTYESVTLEIRYIHKYEVLFPETTFTSDELRYGDGYTEALFTLTRLPRRLDKHITYINGVAYDYVAIPDIDDQILFCAWDNPLIYAATTGNGSSDAYLTINGTHESLTIEVLYEKY